MDNGEEKLPNFDGEIIVTDSTGLSGSVAKGVFAGCAALPLILIVVGLFYVFSWLQSCGTPPPRTPEEQARLDREYEQWEREEAAFREQQAILWDTPASEMDADRLAQELSKCRSAIQRQRSRTNHYAIVWDETDLKRQFDHFKSGIDEVDLRLQQHTTVFDKIEWVEYNCHFKGVGFERFSEGSSRFMDGYIAP